MRVVAMVAMVTVLAPLLTGFDSERGFEVHLSISIRQITRKTGVELLVHSLGR
jgi:Trp operon repressor